MAVTWKAQQLSAARLLAIGYTKGMAASEAGVDLRTVMRWCARSDFHELVLQYQQTAFARVEPMIMANLELALEMQRKVMNGELAPNDPRFAVAHDLIKRFLDRLLYVEPALGAGGNPPPGITVPIQINAQPQIAS